MSWRHVFAGQAFELVAVRTLHRIETFAVWTALDILRVNVAVLALKRHVTLRVAVHAARVHEDRIGREKSGARSSVIALRGWCLFLGGERPGIFGLASLSNEHQRANRECSSDGQRKS